MSVDEDYDGTAVDALVSMSEPVTSSTGAQKRSYSPKADDHEDRRDEKRSKPTPTTPRDEAQSPISEREREQRERERDRDREQRQRERRKSDQSVNESSTHSPHTP
ncbi:hypothetical protein Glove_709g54 [Diversispora epigaea]|uniref:Uncharacterized protein n=1 Tax=Diversispora epigaea TaxID=1348612 RepID=A0A397G1J0_9GLOM|nr:hypothetical protein Glove_709g54 [Diversispora epigaea]